MGLARLAGSTAKVSLEKLRLIPKETQVRYSPAYGFVCDASAYAAEAEACKTVVEKYHKGLLCGFLEPESTIPAFLQELEDAGINAIIQENSASWTPGWP